MNLRRQFPIFLAVVLVLASVAQSDEWEIVDVVDIPDYILYDVYQYILNDVPEVTSPRKAESASVVRDSDEIDVTLQYRLEISPEPTNPGISVSCKYHRFVRELCTYAAIEMESLKSQIERSGQRPCWSRSNIPLEEDMRSACDAPAPQLGR